MKKTQKFFFLILLAASSLGNATVSQSTPTQSGTTGQVLKILQLNFNDEMVMEDGENRFRDRRFPIMVQWIRDNDPDIIFINEGWNYRGFYSVIQALAEAVDYDYNYNVGMGIPFLFADSDGILVKKKFQLSKKQSFECPDGFPVIGSGKDWVLPLGSNTYTSGGRIVLDNGSAAYVYSTHLISESMNVNANLNDSLAIDNAIEKDILANGDDPFTTTKIVGGDFNSDPSQPAPRAFVALGYHDTFAEAHPDAPYDVSCSNCADPTSIYYNPMTIAPGLFPKQAEIGPANRIDYVLASGPQIKTLASTMIFTNTINDIWMSDHSGLFSTIVVGGDAPAGASYPNPIRDLSPPSTPTWIINLNKDSMKCSAPLKCVQTLPNRAVSAALGVTFTNQTAYLMHIKWSGSGQVWARPEDTLGKGESTTFYFDPNIHYTFTVDQVGTLKKLEGSVDSSLQ